MRIKSKVFIHFIRIASGVKPRLGLENISFSGLWARKLQIISSNSSSCSFCSSSCCCRIVAVVSRPLVEGEAALVVFNE